MPAPPTQHTYATAEVVTAANLNTHPQGITWQLRNKPQMLARQVSATTSIPNNAWTIVKMDTVDIDTETGYSTSTGKYTCKVAGWHYITANIVFAANSTGDRGVHIVTSFGNITGVELAPASNLNTGLNFAVMIRLNIGDTVWCEAIQTSGAALSTSTNYASGRAEASFLDIMYLRF
ncbi:hypothetical protein [Nocardia sp. NPDC046763]|uniref:C1q-like domain-containing protein n=1 Tax=Nocardia sp. NPDC046763 TaxID=3155256 RepID=UPI0033E51A7F